MSTERGEAAAKEPQLYSLSVLACASLRITGVNGTNGIFFAEEASRAPRLHQVQLIMMNQMTTIHHA